jgi:hypothetical protein
MHINISIIHYTILVNNLEGFWKIHVFHIIQNRFEFQHRIVKQQNRKDDFLNKKQLARPAGGPQSNNRSHREPKPRTASSHQRDRRNPPR